MNKLTHRPISTSFLFSKIFQASKLHFVLFLIVLSSASTFAQTNTVLGNAAGNALTTGLNNTFIGYRAGFSVQDFTDNTFIGSGAGLHNLRNGNTFVGSAAGYNNTLGRYSTFLGRGAGENNLDGNENTFVGHRSGGENTTGFQNTFLGTWTGLENIDGYRNTFLGYAAGTENTHGIFNTFVGSSSGNNNTEGDRNTFLGYHAGHHNITGDRNLFMGYEAGLANTTGNRNTYLGAEAEGSINNLASSAIGERAYVTGNYNMVLGAVAGFNGAFVNTQVGIGTVAPSHRLHVGVNDAAKPGSSHWTIASDLRLKTGIQEFTEGLAVIDQIRPIRYHYNGKAGTPTDEEFVGVIAQEIKEIAPYMVGEFVHEDTSGAKETYLDYDANALTYLLVNSVKELNKTLKEVLRQNEAQQKELLELKKKLGMQTAKTLPAFSGAKNALGQNYPNPTEGSTRIPYEIQAGALQAELRLVTVSGQLIKAYPLTIGQKGEIEVQLAPLAMGSYFYQLVVDGQVVESKRMVFQQ